MTVASSARLSSRPVSPRKELTAQTRCLPESVMATLSTRRLKLSETNPSVSIHAHFYSTLFQGVAFLIVRPPQRTDGTLDTDPRAKRPDAPSRITHLAPPPPKTSTDSAVAHSAAPSCGPFSTGIGGRLGNLGGPGGPIGFHVAPPSCVARNPLPAAHTQPLSLSAKVSSGAD